MSLEAFRARFPILARRVYVNSCSQGALSTDVEEALGRFTASWHTDGSPWDLWIAEHERLRGAAARLIGAGEDEVAVAPSASAAIAAVATALPFDGPRRGVVLSDLDFPTMGQVWLAQERRGASVAWVREADGGPSIDAYARRIGHDTLVVPLTHVSFRNGCRLDVARLAALCRERGAYSFLDDYQRTGTAPIDVHALGVDFMVTGALKYLLGASGVAFLYVRRELIERLEPLATGWFARRDPFAFTVDRLDWAPRASRFEAGTPPIPAVFAARAGIELVQSVGVGAIERRIGELVRRFDAGARDRGLEVMTPADPARRGPLVVIRSADAQGLAGRLARRGIITSARGPGLRVSFHAYNNEQDVDEVLGQLAAS